MITQSKWTCTIYKVEKDASCDQYDAFIVHSYTSNFSQEHKLAAKYLITSNSDIILVAQGILPSSPFVLLFCTSTVLSHYYQQLNINIVSRKGILRSVCLVNHCPECDDGLEENTLSSSVNKFIFQFRKLFTFPNFSIPCHQEAYNQHVPA